MEKRIYINFLGLILLSSLLISLAVAAFVYNAGMKREMADARDRAVLCADLLNHGLEYSDLRFIDYNNHGADAARLTIIAPGGEVLLDNKADAGTMENHADREEVIAAQTDGTGEIMRYSSTLATNTFFYAIRLDDGNILRVSLTMQKITELLGEIIPVIIASVVFVLLVAIFVAKRLTRNIVRPLTQIDFDGDNTPAYDELIPYMKKIEQQRQKIAAQVLALENRAAVIEDITEHMREGLLMLDRSGSILSANKSVTEIFGDCVGKSILSVCRDIEFQQGVKQCLLGAGAEMHMSRNGQIYSVHFNPAKNDVGGAVILFFDVTERHAAEKQRREFTANVSHELKTPLTSILAYAELIENGMAKEEDIRDFAAKILVQARRLISIIEDIIRLSEFDEGVAGGGLADGSRAKGEQSEFELRGLVEHVIEALNEKAKEKHISITVSGGPFNITANRLMLDELLFNLIDNAIKYNKESGVVAVCLDAADGFHKIGVSDTGIGIADEHKGRVFERFYRADPSRDKKTGGTGLGLSIVKHIAEHHGGRVELESELGKGTTVTCWIAV